MSAGFRGTNIEQDISFSNKQAKLLKETSFPPEYNVKVDMKKVNLDVMKPWITKRVVELLGLEDDVLIEMIFNLLEEQFPNPKEIQILLTGFLEKKVHIFMKELWSLLIDASKSVSGIPAKLVEERKLELLKKKKETQNIAEQISKVESREREYRQEKYKRSPERRRKSRSPRKRRPSPNYSDGYSSSSSDRSRRRHRK